jgi:hypothetical protein
LSGKQSPKENRNSRFDLLTGSDLVSD